MKTSARAGSRPVLKDVRMSTAASWLTPRARGAHKGDAGRVLIVAGSRGMAGAAVLSALGAVRAGGGLVRVATVRSQQPVVARRAPLEVTSAALTEDRAGHVSAAARHELRKLISAFKPDVVAVGPGLGAGAATRALVLDLVMAGETPVVLDADGLNAVASARVTRTFRVPVILTPHPGEMGRLLGRKIGDGDSDRRAAVLAAAGRFGAVALLKGSGTLVTDGGVVWRNTTGNAAMATGGMGDVLTGIVAATWAQMPRRDRASGVRAAALAAHVHGLAGDIAVKDFPERTLLASDLAAALPRAFNRLWRFKARGGRR